MLKQINWSYL